MTDLMPSIFGVRFVHLEKRLLSRGLISIERPTMKQIAMSHYLEPVSWQSTSSERVRQGTE